MSNTDSERDAAYTGTVVVGIDGSECSLRGLAWAQDYAELTGSKLRLVNAWDIVVGYGPFITVPVDDMLVAAKEVMGKARASVTLPDDQVETRLERGLPAQVLVNESADADLLVVGSKGHNPIASIMVGSVSSHCSHHAPCTVAIVR